MARRTSDLDHRYMTRALRLAERGRGLTFPNPVVGAVIVRNGEIVGEGWHRAAGLEHAEVAALRRAGRRAKGATLYVSLEPCAHHGQTPPCVDAVVAAGIRRCVVALRDPHDIVDGRGLRALRRAGVRVDLGVCAAEARHTLAGYWMLHARGRPAVTWKVAATLDGRIADPQGRSKWITSAAARRRAHRMRAWSDAVIVGGGTARRDDPRLTARGVGARKQPLRVVCDTRLSLPLTLKLFSKTLAAGTVVACGAKASPARRRALEARGVRVCVLPADAEGISPDALLRWLARQGCQDVLLEGGARLGTAWLRQGCIDRVALFTAPRVLGCEGLGWCGPLGLAGLRQAITGRLTQCERVGEDALLVVEVRT